MYFSRLLCIDALGLVWRAPDWDSSGLDHRESAGLHLAMRLPDGMLLPATRDPRFFMRQCIGRVDNGRLDVFFLQRRISIEQVIFGRTFGNHSEDQLHRDARAAYHRLAEHDPGIDFDAVIDGHGELHVMPDYTVASL